MIELLGKGINAIMLMVDILLNFGKLSVNRHESLIHQCEENGNQSYDALKMELEIYITGPTLTSLTGCVSINKRIV